MKSFRGGPDAVWSRVHLWRGPVGHCGFGRRRDCTAEVAPASLSCKLCHLRPGHRQTGNLPCLAPATIPIHLSIAQSDEAQGQIVARPPLGILTKRNDWPGQVTAGERRYQRAQLFLHFVGQCATESRLVNNDRVIKGSISGAGVDDDRLAIVKLFRKVRGLDGYGARYG